MSKTIKINGKTFNYELIAANDITRKGESSRSTIALFKILKDDGSHPPAWWTVYCRTFDANGKPTLCTEDGNETSCGHVIARSYEQRDGELVQGSITLSLLAAENPAISHILTLDPRILEATLLKGLEENLKAKGYNLDACTAKMDELKKQGKSKEEVIDYIVKHHTDFITKDKPDTKGDSAKNDEVW